MSDKGFIVLDRALLEWRFNQSPHALALWIRILLKANWADGFFLGQKIERGQFATSIQNLAYESGMHPNTVRHWLKRFEDEQQITLKSTNRYTLINVINYAKYQNCFTDDVKRNVKQDVKQDVNQDVKRDVDNRTIKTRITRKTNIERFTKPTLEQVESYIKEQGFTVDAQRFVDYYDSNGWTINGKAKMKDWQATVRNWQRREKPQKSMPEYSNKPIEAASSEDIESVNAMLERMRNGRKNQTC